MVPALLQYTRWILHSQSWLVVFFIINMVNLALITMGNLLSLIVSWFEFSLQHHYSFHHGRTFLFHHHHHCRSYSPCHNHAIDVPLIKLKYFGWSFHHNERSTLWKGLLLSSLQNHFRFSVSLSAIWLRIYIQHLENTNLDCRSS